MNEYSILFKYSNDGNSWVLTKKKIKAKTPEKAILELRSLYYFLKEIEIFI